MTSKILTAAALPGRLSLVIEGITTLARNLRKLPKAVAHRNELRRLAECDDHALDDVGVTREDLTAALSAPFWRDPSAELVHRLKEFKAEGQCQRVVETMRGIGQPSVSSPELILAACNRRRLPVAPA
jgi:uncharacterized protein YjiS (DUF1127 family)